MYLVRIAYTIHYYTQCIAVGEESISSFYSVAIVRIVYFTTFTVYSCWRGQYILFYSVAGEDSLIAIIHSV